MQTQLVKYLNNKSLNIADYKFEFCRTNVAWVVLCLVPAYVIPAYFVVSSPWMIKMVTLDSNHQSDNLFLYMESETCIRTIYK